LILVARHGTEDLEGRGGLSEGDRAFRKQVGFGIDRRADRYDTELRGGGDSVMSFLKAVHPAWYAIPLVLLVAVLVPLADALLIDLGDKPSRAEPKAVKRAARMGQKAPQEWEDRTVIVDVGEFRAEAGQGYPEGSAAAHALAKAIEANPRVARIEVRYTNTFPSGNACKHAWTYSRPGWRLEWRTDGALAFWYYTDVSDGPLLAAIRKLKPSYGLPDLDLTTRSHGTRMSIGY
jgi:hypothetical protein